MTQEEIWLRLATLKGVRSRKKVGLVHSLLAASRITLGLLQQCGLSAEQAHAFLHPPAHNLSAALAWLEHTGNQLVALGQPEYPALLAHIADPPPVLFVTGVLQSLHSPQVAIVGSRQCSEYGERWASYFARGLVQQGYTITSGLALGIDGIAHRAALQAEGKTLAVMGCGLAHIHPRCHQRLSAQIVEQGGALVSEFLPTVAPLPAHFPRRNRIISGLSRGVLVVEASQRSGSLITARCALEQGREIFALPGPLGSDASSGTHWLIQQGANLVTEPQEIVELLSSSLHWLVEDNPEMAAPTPVFVTGSQQELNICAQDSDAELPFADVLANVGYEVTPVDVVAERAGQPVPEVVVKLLDLELAGWIAAVSGGYVRIRRAGHVRRTNVLI
ncbi:DNA-protecting protein DprA [Nissabacter sp. SGAir0207]|uniref:DNA-protecting protein DprA n=1 Tax=Nissabacter sp. SGAir0207 TaxID=2126321 RepID=UPI0010CD2451|nr:DNA-protecting protein DprA [Nissabacter sp. SGAir0207]QCR34858.1 DNA-protecting protein DprA [Nissabacter sp. SGAir0207]